ncbi:LytR/AlgR family response regulator transcription factor [Pseudomonadota bacterium]
MKILIVDDEPLARARLQDLLEDIGGHNVVGEAANGREALENIYALAPDVVLLDIRMPEINGIEVAMQLTQVETPPAVIFTTAYGDHALKAFDANAVDYLLKPIRSSRLEQALAKVHAPNQAQLKTAVEQQGPRAHICAHHRGGLKLIPVEDIIYFQADSKYISVYHKDGEVLIDEPLKGLEQEFHQQFTRIHRSTLVANSHIESLRKNSDGQHQLILRNIEKPFEVSRRQLPAVRKIISKLSH